ncbi:hypothetical protein VE02_06604 [Pseudogymnoascus sp. 03VT05]|nr:hypothetical protein VE02_06604 [Pseudogymnoascus sp. 03VT05]
MGSVDSLSDTSSEVASMGISHIMKPASKGADGAMGQTSDPEIFRFLNLPSEIRKKIYGNLLVYDRPVVLRSDFLPENKEEDRFVYTTRLGLAPQICRTSKAVAYESFAVLYGKNTFHFTAEDNTISVYHTLGLHVYAEFIKTIMLDTFDATEDMNRSRQNSLWQYNKLRIQSDTWIDQGFSARSSLSLGRLKNLKMLHLNLPPGLEILSESNQKVLLDVKRETPADIAVEFCGATPDVVSKLTAAWPLHVPQETIIPPRKNMHPFMPLQWRREQIKQRRAPLDGYPAGEPRASKKQKLHDGMPRYNLGPLSGLSEQVGRNESKVDTEAQLLDLEEMKLAAEEKALAREKKTLASKEKKIAKVRVALEEERLALEKKTLDLEQDRLALEKKKLAVKGEKCPPSPVSTVSM